MRYAAHKACTLRIVGDAPYDDPFRADQRAIGSDFFDYPLAAFAHRLALALALVQAGCRVPGVVAGSRRPKPAVSVNGRRVYRAARAFTDPAPAAA
ncbi:hypothetical protein L2Y90_22535 [Burkholderia pyrrocinia]|uniref:hypothetical protein n=1 Tax=Burkholderia pyrrocinia TaxID=60550 RepID=UPI00215A2DC1|nr:hypothetical protein [Burkholderia pyrrocinia]UVE69506.1 hypothetical protein L2Y90_22535 [Burkholderia pyrrocinia]